MRRTYRTLIRVIKESSCSVKSHAQPLLPYFPAGHAQNRTAVLSFALGGKRNQDTSFRTSGRHTDIARRLGQGWQLLRMRFRALL